MTDGISEALKDIEPFYRLNKDYEKQVLEKVYGLIEEYNKNNSSSIVINKEALKKYLLIKYSKGDLGNGRKYVKALIVFPSGLRIEIVKTMIYYECIDNYCHKYNSPRTEYNLNINGEEI